MRFAVYQTGTITEPEFVAKCGTFGDLFKSLLAEPGHQWDVFDVQAGHYPQDPTVYDGLVITGSAATAADPLPWIQTLNAAIADAHGRGQKILGICFGHQAVANALGGRSEVNPAGWEVGVHRIQIQPAFHTQPYADGVGDHLRILEIHRDHVADLPPGAVNMAASPTTPHQIYTVGENVLCLQGHPEFFPDVVADLVGKRVDYGLIPTDVGRAALESLQAMEPERALLQRMLKRFLYGA